jgi:hypothetical protein
MCTIAAALSASSVLAGPPFRRLRRTSGARASSRRSARIVTGARGTGRARSSSLASSNGRPIRVPRLLPPHRRVNPHDLPDPLALPFVSSAAAPAALESDDWAAFEEAVEAYHGAEDPDVHHDAEEDAEAEAAAAILAIEKATNLVPTLVAALESGVVDDGKSALKALNAYDQLTYATNECLRKRASHAVSVMRNTRRENPDAPESWEVAKTTPFAELPESRGDFGWSAAHPDWTLEDLRKAFEAANDAQNDVVASMRAFLGAHKDKLAESGLLESAEETLEEAVELKASQKHKKLMDKTFDETQ